jgi:protein-L-isoaspartate(D-aspartate) O-methyltransferase
MRLHLRQESASLVPVRGKYLLEDHFDARFLCPAMFVPCVGARDEETAQKLSVAFKRGDFRNVRSLRRNSQPDETCWCAGDGWWLSNA